MNLDAGISLAPVGLHVPLIHLFSPILRDHPLHHIRPELLVSRMEILGSSGSVVVVGLMVEVEVREVCALVVVVL